VFSEQEYPKVLERLRSARIELGLTQEEVSAAFNRSAEFIASVEDGTRRIDPVELCRFAVVYQKPVTWFLAEVDGTGY
jgi:transcriptional regulator with XRE-family HTH domain